MNLRPMWFSIFLALKDIPMKLIKPLLLLLSLLFLTFSCAKNKVKNKNSSSSKSSFKRGTPNWVNNPGESCSKGYLCAVAEGGGFMVAKANADGAKGSLGARVIDTDFPIESKFDYLPQEAAPGTTLGLGTHSSVFLTVQEGCDNHPPYSRRPPVPAAR